MDDNVPVPNEHIVPLQILHRLDLFLDLLRDYVQSLSIIPRGYKVAPNTPSVLLEYRVLLLGYLLVVVPVELRV